MKALQFIEDSLNMDSNTLKVPSEMFDNEPKPNKDDTIKIEDLEVPVMITKVSEEINNELNKKESIKIPEMPPDKIKMHEVPPDKMKMPEIPPDNMRIPEMAPEE